MEFPNLGQHCSFKICQQLDFLPFTCDLCNQSFCNDHKEYTTHQCPNHQTRVDKYVPTCPVCESPVAVFDQEDADAKVWQHIQNGCVDIEKKKAKKRRRCRYRKCRDVPLVPIKCTYCEKNFCIRHHLPEVHTCGKFSSSHRIRPGNNVARSRLLKAN
eukprot:TRINITY_DN11906_c0_g1_i1.p1 TRINITY_DN11906_c0_g1~~TRINITY_DN11906_c0_g1_i1.p1  ORF type:complete len:170 (+),score=10.69 TRINITY_DN11906_c0_g1_i1:38-511(+)